MAAPPAKAAPLGAAETLVQGQGGEALPILYSFRRCPYAMRARLAIAASGLRCELREVALRDKPPALLEASPKGTVPVLVDRDGSVIDESLDIMLWALRRRDPGGWLRAEIGGLDDMLAVVEQCDGDFKRRLDRYKYPQRYGDVSGAAYRDAAVPWLASLDAMLESRLFLFGNRPALADMATAPFIRQFAHVDKEWFASQPWARLQNWLAGWMQSPLFSQIMLKFPPWKAGEPGRLFPPASPTA